MRILGVTLQQDLSVGSHVDEVLGACAGSLYALRVLRANGLPPAAMHAVTEATTVARLLYAAPAWWGYTSAADRQRLERLLTRTQRMGYLSAGATSIATRVGLAEDRLLQAVVWNESHVLRGLFPPKNSRRPGLRARMHNFDLPCKDDKNFVSRVLYKHINRVPKAIN